MQSDAHDSISPKTSPANAGLAGGCLPAGSPGIATQRTAGAAGAGTGKPRSVSQHGARYPYPWRARVVQRVGRRYPGAFGTGTHVPEMAAARLGHAVSAGDA